MYRTTTLPGNVAAGQDRDRATRSDDAASCIKRYLFQAALIRRRAIVVVDGNSAGLVSITTVYDDEAVTRLRYAARHKRRELA